jgi:tripartite-type tricarboxylate transporter receptor subunit TctC
MMRESRLGRALWLILLVLLGGYVVADFVRSPFSATRGVAAARPAGVTIWAPAGESGGESGPVLAQAVAGLELSGHPTIVKSIPGGSAQALISFLSRRHPKHGQLLAISSTTLADLAHDRRETLVPGAAEEAILARSLLRHSKPVGMLAADPLEVAVERDSPIQTRAEMLGSLTADPSEQVFGIGDNTFSRDQLAALVEGAGVDGEVRFSVLQSDGEADQAIADGSADAVLVGRSAILHGHLRSLGWPLPEPDPYSWVALVAPAATDANDLDTLREWISGLQHDPHWRANLRAEGRRPSAPGVKKLAASIRRTASDDRLERVADRVERE